MLYSVFVCHFASLSCLNIFYEKKAGRLMEGQKAVWPAGKEAVQACPAVRQLLCGKKEKSQEPIA